MADKAGYVDYFEVLELDETAKPGEVRKNYKRKMKDLLFEIGGVEITEEKRARYLLDMAKLNAALCVLRENDTRDEYWNSRNELMALEDRWAQAVAAKSPDMEDLRKEYDGKIRDFLAKYVEELMLAAGRDKEAVEASQWDSNHERHASRILRHYRHVLYHQILERLPFTEVTPPIVNWSERSKFVASVLAGEGR